MHMRLWQNKSVPPFAITDTRPMIAPQDRSRGEEVTRAARAGPRENRNSVETERRAIVQRSGVTLSRRNLQV